MNLIEAIPVQKSAARSVFREVVERGSAKGLADAFAVARLFDAGIINIAEPSDKSLLRTFTKTRGLEEPDAETLVVAKERDYKAVVDDLLARKVARTYGIDFVGTPHMLFLRIQSLPLTKDDAVKVVEDIECSATGGP